MCSITKSVAACAALFTTWSAFGLGSDYRNNEPVGGTSAWPPGLKELVNTTNRVHGYFVNAEDVFFFVGAATTFNEFLRDYAKLEGIANHRLILHERVGEAKSPWNTNGLACDWKLHACPSSWLTRNAKDKTFTLEIHFWTGGKIALDQIALPKNVEVTGGCLNVFDSLTNGMTRAEVERRFSRDGGIQGASPIRLLHPSYPLFKVDVEFGFKRNAADQNRAIISKDDKVIRVSKPYLQRPYYD